MDTLTRTPADQARRLVGHRYRLTDHYEVGREKIREFARALQDPHPAYHNELGAAELGFDALIAPPTFATLPWMRVQEEVFSTHLYDYDLGQVLQADQMLEFARPLTAGDELTADVYFQSFRQVRDLDLLTTKNVLTDRHGVPVQAGTTTLVARAGGGRSDLADLVDGIIMNGLATADRRARHARDAGALLPVSGDAITVTPRVRRPRTACTAADLAPGEQLPTRTVQLTRGDLANFAGVSGDANPIHFSDEVARAAGLPSVVAHGMLTMGLGAAYLTGWAGDPAALTRYGVRFAGTLPVSNGTPSSIEFGGTVKSVDPVQRTATIALTATGNGRKLFSRATAVIALR
ncbi:fused (3R)-hydroxyacyl-ACP dehydratase subunits HadA/HadB [Nocardia blacklockiae]|uniref:fused (3R)-hydroxyacyl-ACP dehydratase subunits HadA/HadB n=1 Tax=Nocardia blacklockiae TaxID=480036 RepID=UPI001894E89A|nr:fused (3R)-hydroxyacyl-ACP dehydratase subunits HadA/HadB [Nocardia blacklockiae]MBF6174934.1 MaoC family dehydratase N-terminal domain-containing protein [Nocardia blacklockiae]